VPRQPRPVQRWRRRSPRGGQARGAIRRHIASARMLALPEHFVSVRGPCHRRRWWHPLISTDREKNDKGDFASLRLSRLGRSGRRIQTFRSTPWQLTAGILERRKSTPSKGGRRTAISPVTLPHGKPCHCTQFVRDCSRTRPAFVPMVAIRASSISGCNSSLVVRPSYRRHSRTYSIYPTGYNECRNRKITAALAEFPAAERIAKAQKPKLVITPVIACMRLA
jgi:hypothetical protein